MPRMTTENFGSGNTAWVGTEHGIANCRTETVNTSAFTKEDHYPDGYIRSGQPVAKVDNALVPYDADEGTVTAAGILAGFILTDQRVAGSEDFPAPLCDHGRVRTTKLPVSFVKPADSAKLSATTIVFV